MKRLLISATLLLLACGTALASGKGQPLADNQLDEISAGSAIAIGHNSTAQNTTTATVKLGDNALKGATAVNMVNAADSTVANGVNVAFGSAGAGEVKQLNILLQKGIPDGGPAEFEVETAPVGIDGKWDLAIIKKFEAELAVDALAIAGGHATNNSDFSVSLDGSAEANAKAVNIVNAAGSLVANGVNVAAGGTLDGVSAGSTMNALPSSSTVNNLGGLTQVNIIAQLAH